MRNRISTVLFALLLLASHSITGCASREADPWSAAGNKPKVLVSFPALYSFAKSVAGDDADVRCLLTTVGPHYEGDATQDQVTLARGCNLFIVNGLGMDDQLPNRLWMEKGGKVLDLGAQLDPATLKEGECKHDHGHDHAGHEHGIDPHAWLGIRHVKVMVGAIRDELAKLDPTHAAGYQTRATEYLGRLDRLQVEGTRLLAGKKEKSIVSFHESLGYFAECYGLDIAGVIELMPGKEPTADDIKKILKKCKSNNIRVIAVEPQFSVNTSARVIRDELRTANIESEFVVVDPLETCEPKDLKADLFERVMKQNLENLAKALR